MRPTGCSSARNSCVSGASTGVFMTPGATALRIIFWRTQIVSSRFSLASSHEIPLPTLSEVRTIPSRIFSGSSIIASAQSTYSSQWAVGVAQRRCVLISGIRCDDSNRLLEPIDSFLFQLPSATNGFRACQRLIVVHHDRNIAAGNALTDCVQSGQVLGKRRVSQPELNGPKTALQKSLNFFREAIRLHQPEPATVICAERFRAGPE